MNAQVTKMSGFHLTNIQNVSHDGPGPGLLLLTLNLINVF